MREHRAAAVTAGTMDIIRTVAGVAGRLVTAPVRDGGDVFAAATGTSPHRAG